MKRSIYLKLEEIPEGDRADYLLCTEVGSPHFNKYVLQLDGTHPVQLKNTELLAEKQTRETTHQNAIAQKDAQITSLTTEVTVAKQTQVLPAGQVAISSEDSDFLNKVRGIGKFEDIKAKVEGYDTMKVEVETQKRKELLIEAAKAHGFDPDAFVLLAEPKKLNESLELRMVDDGKGKGEKIKQFFVKAKDPATNQETFVPLNEFIKTDDAFKPFLGSLTPKAGNANTVTIPNNGTGETPKEASGAAAYIGRAYKRPDAQKAAA